jgi:hypothetical protein
MMDCVIRATNTDLLLEQKRDFKLRIKGKNKLVGDGDVFIRKEKLLTILIRKPVR